MLQLARNLLRGLFISVLIIGAAQAQLIFNPGQGGGAGGGTVTSIGITQTGTVFTIGGSPVTTNGNINLAFSATGMATFLATPSSANLFATLTTKTGSGGSVVFATGPTVSGLILSDVATGTQCLHANSSGVVSGTGSDCGAGGGGDTITSPNSTLTVGGTSTNTTLDVNLTNPNSWTGLQTFGAHASIAATAHGVLVSENTSAVVALAVGGANTVLLGNAAADPSFGAVPLAAMAVQGANTILGNYTVGSAVPTAGAAPAGGTSGCSGTTDAVIYTASTGWGCHQISGASTALSSVTAAAGANTIANGNNGAQIWNWAQTTAGQIAFTFGETTAATSTGVPYELRATTLSGSTATPLKVDNSLTGAQTLPALAILPTWNTSGVVDAALLINVTNTASGTASLLIDAQIGGTSQFKVDKAGNVTALTSVIVGNPTGGVGSSFFLTQEGTVPSSLSASGQDNCYADSTQHGILCNYNAGTTLPLVQGPASDTSGHVASFTGTNGGALADSGIVASNVVTAAGTLTSTAIMTGAGTKTAQTPSTTSTLDGSGNLAVAAGGSIGSADTGTPKLTFAVNKMTANQPLVLGTTSNQLVTGTTTNLTTLTFPASSGAITLTFPLTSELMVGSNSDTTTTHVLHASAVAGVGSFSAIATGDLPGAGATTVNGQTCTLGSTCAVESATSGQMAVSGGSGAALTGAADMTYSTHTFATTTAGIFDWSSATGASSFKLPAVIGGTLLAGTSTANLSAPIVLQNTNSSNSNTSITVGITAPGTSTGQTVLNVNGAATGADLQDWGTGGTWASGVLSGQTVVASVLPSGAVQTKGTTAGFHAFAQGSTSAAVAPCNSSNTACFQAPAAVTSYVANVPAAAPTNNNAAMIFSNANPAVGSFAKIPQTAFNTSYTNATTTFSSITGLSFAVEASTNYRMTCDLTYQGSVSTTGLKVQITGPASPTSVSINFTQTTTTSATAAATFSSESATAFSSALGDTLAITATTNMPAQLTMSLANGVNAGTVQVQGAADGTGTVTVQPSSCVMQ